MESSRLTYPDRFYTVAAYAPHKDEAIVGSPSPSLLWDEPFPSSVTTTVAAAGGMGQHLLMCSFGGRIIPCSTGKSLCYLCGEIQIMAVNQHASRADIHACLSRLLLGGRPVMLKYQLPTLLAVVAARSSAPPPSSSRGSTVHGAGSTLIVSSARPSSPSSMDPLRLAQELFTCVALLHGSTALGAGALRARCSPPWIHCARRRSSSRAHLAFPSPVVGECWYVYWPLTISPQ